VQDVRIATLADAQEAQDTVNASVDRALGSKVADSLKASVDHQLLHNINDAVGNAFGPIIGRQVPSVMLRSWLYGLLVNTIAFVIAGDQETVTQLEKVLQRWQRGNYLIGFDTTEATPVAVVIVDNN
ncbi:MAG: hypothetical protein AAB649_06890, partial [Patescibacteria group bacterium]